ncbi:MAG: S-layer homology domain-containing protein [Chloroflexi bacterium]|nr:S-layer homology domain-containing protein [Chloroflexota bacterium]
MKHKLISLFVLLALLLAGMPVQPARAAGVIIYVDADSGCSSSCGGSWAAAHRTLQAALTAAKSSDQLWVAEGVYYPGAAGDRTVTFTLKNGVAIYGGFNGTETRLSSRDWQVNPTILSGDIDQNDVNLDGNFVAETTANIIGDNAYNVVTGGGTDNTAILDGFTITAGRANLLDASFATGGGMYNSSSSPTLTNLTFSGNFAAFSGGGMFNSSSSPTLSNVTFGGNWATAGGGMFNTNSNPFLTNVSFQNNSAADGGGMANINSAPVISGGTFDQNTATSKGGGLYNDNSDLSLSNTDFTLNNAANGGGIYNANGSNLMLNGGQIFGNSTTTGNGGGIYNSLSMISLVTVDINSNRADNSGGGIFNDIGNLTSASTFSLTNVKFIMNISNSGGGMYNGELSSGTLTNVEFYENVSTGFQGGGMNNSSAGNLALENVTFTNNYAPKGGGMNNNYTDPSLTNVTFHHNGSQGNAGMGGGMYNNASHPILINTVIADSESGGDCAGSTLDSASSNNLIEDSAFACGLTNGDANGNIVGLDPNLGPLADNGGFTQTHALLTGSPAIDAGDDASCPDTDQRGLSRPWDGDGSGGAACDIGAYEVPYPSPVFADVPVGYWAISHIESLYANGITGGCTVSPLNYCPANPVTRAQMAVFLLKAMYGAACVPADATGTIFNDVPASNPFAKWIEQLAAEGITGGCGGGNYCPNTPVTREQMAVFLLVAEHGTGYTPPAATGVFADVPASNGFAPWIEQLAAEGITGGCGGGNFCPKTVVTRAQMAVFLVSAFNLP